MLNHKLLQGLPAPELRREELERLRSLGYVEWNRHWLWCPALSLWSDVGQ